MESISLKTSIKEAILELELAYNSSNEEIIKDFLIKYKEVYNNIENKSNLPKYLNQIKYCTKIYLQVSSNYNQKFLNKMSVVESIIKNKKL